MGTDLTKLDWRKSSRSGNNGGCIEVAASWRKSTRSSNNGGCVEVATGWRTSRHSASNGGCVEVADAGLVIAVRDSKNPSGPRLLFAADGWSTFVAQAGSFVTNRD